MVEQFFGCRASPGPQRSSCPRLSLQLELPVPDAAQLHHPLSPLSLIQEDYAQRGGWQTPLPPLTDGFGRPDSSPALFQPPAQDVDLMEGRFGCGLAHMRLYWENMAGRRVCVFSRVVCVRVCPQTAPDCRHPSCSGTLAESGAQTASLTHGRLNCLLNRPGPWRS